MKLRTFIHADAKYEGTKEFSKVLIKIAAMNVLENGNSTKMFSMQRHNENNVKNFDNAFLTKN